MVDHDHGPPGLPYLPPGGGGKGGGKLADPPMNKKTVSYLTLQEGLRAIHLISLVTRRTLDTWCQFEYLFWTSAKKMLSLK